jgi:hypothetical protein
MKLFGVSLAAGTAFRPCATTASVAAFPIPNGTAFKYPSCIYDGTKYQKVLGRTHDACSL